MGDGSCAVRLWSILGNNAATQTTGSSVSIVFSLFLYGEVKALHYSKEVSTALNQKVNAIGGQGMRKNPCTKQIPSL